MRVLQITPAYYPYMEAGGMAQKTQELSSGLAKLSHEVHVVTFNPKKPTARDSRIINGVVVQYLPWIGTENRNLPISPAILRREICWADIVHCYGLYNFLCPPATAAALQNRRPYILEPLGMFIPRLRHSRIKHMYNRIFTNRMLAKASRVITTSPIEQKELSPMVPTERLVLRRDGIDLDLFGQLPPRSLFRTQFGLADKERLILFIGRISPIKNLEQIVEAFHLSGIGHARLILVGPMSEPEYAARLRGIIQRYGLTDRILLIGPLYEQDKIAALAAADLFVLPSLYESFGIAAAEAVAAGVPVLLTQTCGIAPLIHERAGLAVPLSTKALAEGMRVLLEDLELRQKLTCRANEVAVELSIDEPVRMMEQLYQQVLKEGGH